MKINFDQTIMNVYGEPIMNGDKEVTLKFCAIQALMGVYPEETLEGDEKLNRFRLAKKIQKGVQDLSLEDVTKIKTIIKKHFNHPVIGPCCELLDETEVKDA